VTSFAYDAKNNLTAVTDPLGFSTTLTYDPTTNVLLSVSRQVDATTSAVTRYEYGDAANPGLPTKVIAPRGNTSGTPDPAFATTLAYDAQANLTSRTDPDGARTTFQYDAAGRLVSFVDPDGNAPGGVAAEHTWTIAYDANDRETMRTDPLGNAVSYLYDAAGLRTGVTDRNGNLTFYAYDANARLVAVQQQPDPFAPLTYTTTVTRDANGNATRITQANGVITDYAFDALDRLTSVTTYPTPTGPLATSYVLDGNGQPTSRTTGDGVTVTYAYDGLSRLTGVSGPGLSISYAYDASGRRTAMSDATGTTTYQYDGLGRVTQVAAAGGTLGYAYDRDGNRTSLTYPGGDVVTYAYSPGGRMATVTDWAGRASTYSYTPAGLVAQLTHPSGLVASYTYDRAQRLVSLAYRRTIAGVPVTVFGQAFTLDAEGNRTQLSETVRVDLPTGPVTTTDVFSMTYDGLLRLTALSGVLFGGGTSSETFTYDGATNLSARSGPAAAYAIDGANRLTSDGARAFGWDGADRLVARGADTFSYDALSRMTSSTVAGPLGPLTRTYAYDGDGLLRSRTEGPSTTGFLWDGSTAPAPLLQAGSDRVVHGLGPLYLARAAGTTLTFVRDALGSVRAEATDAGLATSAFRYAAYGEIAQATPAGAVPTLLGFTGELRGPSGLIYLRARWYDPGTARFMTRDPFPGFAARPASLNGFAYAAGRPSLLTDPLGLDPESDTGAGVHCFIFLTCSPRAQLSVEAQSALSQVVTLHVPVRGPFGGTVILLAGGTTRGSTVSSRGDASPPPAGPGQDPHKMTYLYQKVSASGQHLKFGITNHPSTRYSKAQLAGGRLKILAEGERTEMLRLERQLHETLPLGPEEGQSFYFERQLAGIR
jgi:RHS repeat-associated protein